MSDSAFRSMWILVMFDLPTDTRRARKEYARFRKGLLEDGFTQMQYSVYSRYCSSSKKAAPHVARVEASIPPDGQVRILVVTERQFRDMRVFFGKRRTAVEEAPKQLQFF